MKSWRLPNSARVGKSAMQTNEELTPELSLAKNGKSFDWAGRLLNNKTGRDAAQLYSFCRILDDMADGDIPNGPQRLLAVRFGLSNRSTSEDLILMELTNFIIRKKIPFEIIIAMIDGLLQDQNIVDVKDEDELLQYCYRVAGTVGLMMSQILGCTEKNALLHAIDLGIAMQLTNIARDVLEDAHMGRRYLPASWVGDISPDKILSVSGSGACQEQEKISTAVKQLIDLSEIYYKSGLVGLIYLRPRDHLAIAVAAKIYRQIGIQIKSNGYKWYKGREVTTKRAKFACSIRSTRNLTSRLFQIPQHEKSLHAALSGLPYVN